MIRALFTDFGGVLVRSRTDAPRRALEVRLGLPPNTIEERVFGGDLSVRAQRGEISHDDYWEHLGRDLPLDGRMTVAQFRDEFFSADFLDEALMALIRSVRPSIKTGLISNAWANGRYIFTEVFAIASAFDTLVISAEEKVMKPDPRIYHIALDRLGVAAGESIFIDDMLPNVRGAEAVGMIGVHFQPAED